MRAVLITGGSQGIGAAMVRRFAGAGDRVAFTYLNSRREADALARQTGALAIRSDVSKADDCTSAVAQAVGSFGRIDVLVNNAGVDLNRLLMDTTDEEYRRVMDTNVFGTFAMMRAALPYMIEQRGGAIVNVSSIWGQRGGACEAVYSASKAAVIALTKAAAREAADANVRVNCIAPGMIDTRMNGRLSVAEKDDLEQEIPLGRSGTVEEAAAAAFFLAGSDAAYITGEVLAVNGGWLI